MPVVLATRSFNHWSLTYAFVSTILEQKKESARIWDAKCKNIIYVLFLYILFYLSNVTKVAL